MKYFLLMDFTVICIHYLTGEALFHFSKSENISSFHVNCRMLLIHVPAGILSLRKIDLSNTELLNQSKNNNIYKVTPFAIS